MSKKNKLKADLILEVAQLQERVAELETADAEHKQALETLHDSERRFKTIFTDAAIGIDIVDADGSPILANRALQEMLGYSDDELRSMVFADYTHPDDIEENLRLVQEVREGKRDHFTMEKRYIRKDGAVIWGHTSVSGLRDSRGNFQHFIAMVDDINESKHAEDELKESEAKYRQLFECETDAIWVFDAETLQFEEVNQAALDLLGYTKNEFLKLVAQDVSSEKRKTLKAIKGASKEGPDKGIIPLRYSLKKDGTTFPSEIAWGKFKSKGRMKIVGAIRDITERTQAEKTLRESERELKEAQELGCIGRWEYELDTQKIKWSEQVFKLYERDPALGEPTPEEEATYYSPEESARLREYSRQAIEEIKSFEYDLQVQLPSGKTSYMTASMRPITDESGRVIKLVGIVQDITERKQAEQELEDIFNLSPDMVGVFTTEGKLLRVNPAWEKILGYKQKELFDMGWAGLVHPDDVEVTNRTVNKQLEGSSVVNFVNRYRCKDGSFKTLEWQATYAQEGIVHATARDVTEHMQRDEKLRESEQKYRQLVVLAQEGIWVIDKDSLTTFVNPSMERILGYSDDEMVGKHLFSFMDERGVEIATHNVERRKQGITEQHDFELLRKDGTRIYVTMETAPIVDEDGNYAGSIAGMIDITERKQAEDVIHRRAEELSTLLRVSQALNATLEMETVLQTTTDGATDLLRIDSAAIYLLEGEELFLGATTPPLDPQMPEAFRLARLVDHPLIKKAVSTRLPVTLADAATADLAPAERAISEASGLRTIVYVPILVEKRTLGTLILGTVGKTRVFSETEINLCQTLANQIAFSIQNATLHKKSIQHATDLKDQIRERIRAEEALQTSEYQLRQIINLIPHFIFAKDSKGRFIMANQAVAASLDTTVDKLIGKTDADFYSPEEAKRYQEQDQGIIKAGKPLFISEERHLGPEGVEYFVQTTKIPFQDVKNKEPAVLGVVIDVTELKRTGEALRESEEKFRNYVETSQDLIWELDAEGRFTYLNPAWEQVTGYKLSEMLGKPFTEFTKEEEVEKNSAEFARHLEGGFVKGFPSTYISKNGSEIALIFNAIPLLDSKKNIIGTQGSAYDITERVQAEEAIRESETRIRDLMETVPIGISISSPEGDILEVNTAMLEIYGYDLSEEFVNVSAVAHYYNSKDRERFVKLIEKDLVKDLELQYKRKDGSVFWGSTTSLMATTAAGNTEYINTFTDITERKKAEQEKDLLLEQVQVANERLRFLSRELINSQEDERKHIAQELHDELGQALTAISLDLGIIERDLPPEIAPDIMQRLSATIAMADELDERISELALDLRPSLLDDLGLLPALRWYVDRYSQRAEVEVEMDIIGLEERLPPEIEITLYRVFQEALTNVARHAQASKVRLQIDRRSTAVAVTIEDDGRGFDAGEFQISGAPLRSLGLVGMRERISLLGGRLELHSKFGEGTRIDIEIPL